MKTNLNHPLTIHNLSKSINSNRILNQINLSINQNEIVTIIGQSGAGKTTLLRVLNGLTNYDQGEILFNNQKVDYQSKLALKNLPQKIGLVFQNFNLYPHLTVIENITLSPILNKKYKPEIIYEQARNWLSLLKIENQAEKYPFQLSGGEKQRVAIARACILNPDILCFDEPTSALDPFLTQEIAKMLTELKKRVTILIVTHDMEFAKIVSDRIIVMKNGQIIKEAKTLEYFA